MIKRLFAKQPTARLTTGESGAAAQRFVEKALRKSGHKIIARNLSDSQGELDLIFKHPKDYPGVIVGEVRSFRPRHGKTLSDVLPDRKKKQVMESARRILPKKKIWQSGDDLRFDALIVELNEEGNPVKFQHFKADFWPDDPSRF